MKSIPMRVEACHANGTMRKNAWIGEIVSTLTLGIHAREERMPLAPLPASRARQSQIDLMQTL